MEMELEDGISRKMKNEEKANNFYHKLRLDCKKMYSEKMEKIFNSTELYFKDTDLDKLHSEALQLVCLI